MNKKPKARIESRVNKVIGELRELALLSQYQSHYSAEDVTKIKAAIDAQLNETFERLSNPTDDTFKLSA